MLAKPPAVQEITQRSIENIGKCLSNRFGKDSNLLPGELGSRMELKGNACSATSEMGLSEEIGLPVGVVADECPEVCEELVGGRPCVEHPSSHVVPSRRICGEEPMGSWDSGRPLRCLVGLDPSCWA